MHRQTNVETGMHMEMSTTVYCYNMFSLFVQYLPAYVFVSFYFHIYCMYTLFRHTPPFIIHRWTFYMQEIFSASSWFFIYQVSSFINRNNLAIYGQKVGYILSLLTLLKHNLNSFTNFIHLNQTWYSSATHLFLL